MLENPHLAQEQSFEVNELSDDIKKDEIVLPNEAIVKKPKQMFCTYGKISFLCNHTLLKKY